MVNKKNTTEHYYRNEDGIVLYKVESSEWFQNGSLKKAFDATIKTKAKNGLMILKTLNQCFMRSHL